MASVGMKPLELLESIQRLEADRFDLVDSPGIRALSAVHWTPVVIARQAAGFLVCKPGTRVLDIGCGPGKFCIAGALTTEGRFMTDRRRDRGFLEAMMVKPASLPVEVSYNLMRDG